MELTRQRARVPHFFKPILPGFDQALSIPKDFMKGEKLEGEAVLKSDNLTRRLWTVNIDQRRFVCEGWKDFAKEHDLHIGDFLVFGHQGGMVFHVTVFDLTACERHYSPQDDQGRKRKRSESDAPTKHRQNNHRETSLVLHSSSSMEGIKQGEAPYFTLTMNCSNIEHNLLYVPRKFVKDNGFTNIYGVIILRNKMGRCWQVNMRSKKSGQVYISGDGWKDFVEHNRLQLGNVCTFRLISSGTKVVFQVSISRTSENRQLSSSSTRKKRKTKISQDLDWDFARAVGLTKRFRQVTLRDVRGSCWQAIAKSKTGGRFFIASGWRDFSNAHMLKMGDVCTFKLTSTRNMRMEFDVTIFQDLDCCYLS